MLMTQAIVLPFCLKSNDLRGHQLWTTCLAMPVDKQKGFPWNTISERNKFMVFFWNIIKSSSEYFECGIIHFPRNQPRKTDSSTREVPPRCHPCLTVPSGTWTGASHASLLHHCALKTQFLSALPSLGKPGSFLLILTLLPYEPGTLHRPMEAPKPSADKCIERANASHLKDWAGVFQQPAGGTEGQRTDTVRSGWLLPWKLASRCKQETSRWTGWVQKNHRWAQIIISQTPVVLP